MFFIIIPARSSYRPRPPRHTGPAHPVIHTGLAHPVIPASPTPSYRRKPVSRFSGVSVIARILDPGLRRGYVKAPTIE